ncbi:unnamed protein product [Triticum turgidum subsp. durum]|uniref:Purple acid phosphatase n=1 Tax=Triticum turgidum subsp. durum TaxID=4567 RepID=A0A9R0Z2T5_TRITD|nr:unnamed protein product [Triticum turgidum subsp. durum]
MGMAHVAVLAAVLAMAATASASPEAGVQPLSKIAIHKATVELHGSAYVRASALLLGDGDQQEGDTATVTVEYGWQNPATDDWIAVFSPSDFISGSCPNPRRYPTEPLLCTTPIKYQYANFSANYLYWGKGTIQFQLINQRSDFSFALFTGGLENPKLVGLTKLSPFKNPKAPVFPRLAQGKTHDEMAVTWTSGYDVGDAYPFVEWGMVTSGTGAGNPTRSPAGTLTFNRGSMCGAPARTIGWRDPGFIHTAFMRGLWPNKETMYYYPAENRANFWYKVDYGMFRFCVADSEHDWREGTPQHKFIEECLSTVDRKHQPWLIFTAHRVLGYSSNKWYAEQGSFEEPEGRESLQKLWQRHRVDLAIFGHVHNYERTCPLYQNQCVTGERSRYSGTMNGTIFVVAGGGGSHLNGYTSAVPKWSVFRDRDYGFTKLTAFNHSSLLFEYKRSSDGKVYDNFTIHRDYRDVLGCVHDSCFPTTLAT